MPESYVIAEKTLNIKDIARIIRRRRTLLLAVWVAVVGAVTLMTFMSPKVYQAETTLRIKQSKGLGESLLDALPFGDPTLTKQQLSTYIEIIKSRTVLEEVSRLLKPSGKVKPDYEALSGRIIISPVKDTEILRIQATAGTPNEAKQVANLVVDVFIRRLVSMSRSGQSMVREFIGERLQEAKHELDQAEKSLKDYKIRNQIISPTEETRTVVDQLAEVNKLVAQNQIELAACQARLVNADQQLSKEKTDFVADNALIQQCRSKLVELEVEQVGLLQKYTENHPRVQALRASIDETKKALSGEIDRVVNAEASSLNPVHQGLFQDKLKAEAEVTALSAQKLALERVVAQEEGLLTKLPVKEQGLARVMRDSMLAQEIYVMLAKRHEESRISEVMQPADIQIVDRAIAPDRNKPIKPNKKLNLFIAVILGMFAGLGLAVGVEYFCQTIDDGDDVQQYLGVPVLGNIPRFDSKHLDVEA